ncbi:MAG: hypothetical protein U5K54_27665 [Cytophagales bacterium]|nr:hypothetical protein [Cytophagales bacterium]
MEKQISLQGKKAIVVEGKLIKEIIEWEKIPAKATVIDLSSKTVLPGLIDCHTHVLLQGDITSEEYDAQLLKGKHSLSHASCQCGVQDCAHEWLRDHSRCRNRRRDVCGCGFEKSNQQWSDSRTTHVCVHSRD